MVQAGAAWVVVAGCFAAWTQAQTGAPGSVLASPSQAGAPVQSSSQDQSVAGGKLHGTVKSGNIPLPGVTVTAQNTLTGKRYSTTTDIAGAWQMNIPQNGRYVIRTQFAAFAQGSQEAVLNAASHDQLVNFELILASRQAELDRQQAQEPARTGRPGEGLRQMAGNAPESMNLENALSADTDTGAGTEGESGAALPSIAANSDFSGESVAITGQAGQVSAFVGMDMDRLRDAVQSIQVQGGLNGQNGPGQGGQGGEGNFAAQGGLFGGYGGGGFGGAFGGSGFAGGGFGGPGGGGFGGRGGGGGGRNFRNFNPAQPHGAVAWNGNTSYFNAQPFALIGQPQQQPANGSNRFTISFMSAPYIPHLTKPSGKDTVFLTLAGTRQSTPDDFYATVPTLAERGGDFSALGLPPIYNPVTGSQFSGNQIPSPPSGQPCVVGRQICPQAAALLAYFPPPLANAETVNGYNYHLLTTAQSNSTNGGIRYNRSLGANATQPGGGRGGFGGGRRSGSQNQGLRQSINLNYNQSHSASDLVNMFPQLGGKMASNSYSVQAGYTVGYHRFTNISNLSWNRSDSNTANFFTNTANNVAGPGPNGAGINVPNQVPLNYGLPDISLSNGIQGLTEIQPSFSVAQTVSFSEVLSWIHGKHNMRYGFDYRRVHRDFLAGSNATGNFAFTGLFTEQFVPNPTPGGPPLPVAGTGSSIADFLLGLPQSTTLNSSLSKSYLRDNIYDAFATDDWRVLPSLTLNYGVRWEFFAPYTEKYGHLADIYTNPDNAFATETEQTSGQNGLPASLVFPFHKAFAPRVGLAWRVPKIKSTVLRAGFGMNYTVGEYATFATTMAHQPMIINGQAFNNEQTNQEAQGNTPSTACVQSVTQPCFTLQNGFTQTGQTVGSYALDPHYGLPYVMAWNLDLQKTLPLGMVLNLGYNGARSNHLDVKLAPRALPNSKGTDPSIPNPNPFNPQPVSFNYDEAAAYYKNHQATVRVNKRLQKGVSLGANYQYGHAIDDATSVNGSSGSVVQDWQNLAAQEGHSVLDVRHQVSGTYLFELPFGPDKYWITSGAGAHILEGFSVSGSFTFATGGWVSPGFEPTAQSVECGNAGALRPNFTGQSVLAGGGSLRHWFNTAAYTAPSNTQGFCDYFGSAPRNSIEGPGTVSNNMALSKTMNMGETRSMEIRAQIDNVFNTVQYSGVDTTCAAFGFISPGSGGYSTCNDPKFGGVASVGQMRNFQFMARFRF